MDISNVVSSSTVIQDASVSRAGFGTIGIFTYHDLGPAVRTYPTTPAGRTAMAADGLGPGTDAYEKASAIGRQQIKVPTIKVFQRTADNEQEVNIIPLVTTEGYVYDFSVKVGAITTTISYTVLASATTNSVSTALQALLDAVTGIDASDDTGSVTITPTTVGDRFFLDHAGDLTVKDVSADAGIATALATGQAADPDFYGVLTDGYSEAELNAAAAWCEANGKEFLALSNDTDVLTSSTTDVGSDFEGAAYTRCGVLFSKKQSQQMAAGILGRQFAQLPGASDWNNKVLSGTADDLTAGQLGYAVAKNVCLFARIGNLNVTHNMKTSSGRLFDTTRDVDWFEANLQADLFTVLVNNEKLPYDATGKSLARSSAMNRGRIAGERGVFQVGTYQTTFLADGLDDPADVAAQLLRFSWQAVKSIGIAKIAVTGTVTL